MRFFSKIVFICNLCFAVTVLLRWVEFTGSRQHGSNDALGYQPLVSSLVILGYIAVIINLVYCIIAGIALLRKQPVQVASWLTVLNVFFLLAQLYYFFIS